LQSALAVLDGLSGSVDAPALVTGFAVIDTDVGCSSLDLPGELVI